MLMCASDRLYILETLLFCVYLFYTADFRLDMNLIGSFHRPFPVCMSKVKVGSDGFKRGQGASECFCLLDSVSSCAMSTELCKHNDCSHFAYCLLW